MPDPAVADPVTAAAPPAVPEPFVPSTEPMVAPPTAAPAPDPEGLPKEPVPATTDYEELLSGLSDEDRVRVAEQLVSKLPEDALKELAPVKSLNARTSESVRRTTERESARSSYTATQAYAGSEAVISDLAVIAREAALAPDENGNPVIAPEKVGKAANAVLARGVAVGVNLLSRYLEEQAGDSFTLTKTEQDAIDAAQVLYHQHPLDPTPLIRAWMGPSYRAQQANLRDELRAELTPQIRREEQERIRAEAAAAAGETRAGAPSATPLNGASPSMAAPPADLTTFIGISAALRRGQITDDAAQQAYAKLNN